MAGTDRPDTSDDPTTELTSGLSDTARALFSAGGATDTLRLLVDLAVDTVEGCDAAGIFLIEGDAITTPVHTGEVVAEIDALQRRTGEGPCLDAIATEPTVYAGDLAGDARWPHFAPLAVSAGIRSALALRLSANGTRGALNLYAHYPQAFGIVDRAKALILATFAGVALSSAAARDDDARRVDNLQAALVSRELIGQAEGILIERERISGQQAFDILRRASQHLNIKLHDVARNLVETGEVPPTGPPEAPR